MFSQLTDNIFFWQRLFVVIMSVIVLTLFTHLFWLSFSIICCLTILLFGCFLIDWQIGSTRFVHGLISSLNVKLLKNNLVVFVPSIQYSDIFPVKFMFIIVHMFLHERVATVLYVVFLEVPLIYLVNNIQLVFSRCTLQFVYYRLQLF